MVNFLDSNGMMSDERIKSFLATITFGYDTPN